ncbi:MAG: hypothetical protein Q8R28_06255 [Dehalococcoidia bacterium]|nr:hypothetical protein [Dehalococcoidia bacterium]
MNDTSPEMEERFIAMLMARSGEDRLRMACDMNETARSLVLASLLAENPNATQAELRKGLFLRFYGDDFSPEQTRRILEFLERG